MLILQVHPRDVGGGAVRVARNLQRGYRVRGHSSWLAVARKETSDAQVIRLQHHRSAAGWARLWWYAHDLSSPFAARVKGFGKLSRALATMAVPSKAVAQFRGIEDFEFPGSRHLLDLAPGTPDIIHLHNLHGGYFDLRVLPTLSRRIPTIITLHDAWMFTGHCAHPLDCERWQHGCGLCPYLNTYPAVRRDATDLNWARKKDIYRSSSLFIAAPSNWLLERAERSILAEGIIGSRVIPNGVDLSVFRPGERRSARNHIGLPQDERVLLFSGFSPDRSSYKDLPTLRAAVEILGNDSRRERITLVVLGGAEATQTIGRTTIRSFAFEADDAKVITFYQAADIYVHAARVGGETAGLSILEALACGLPIVATGVGGIPEHVKSYPVDFLPSMHGSTADGATGILTPPGDPNALSAAIGYLLDNDSLSLVMSSNAVQDAQRRFDQDAQTDAYLDWYVEIIESHKETMARMSETTD